MNWYKIAQIPKRDFYEEGLQPSTVSNLSGISAAWVSPTGIIYPMTKQQYLHVYWVDDNKDYLNRKYNMPFLQYLEPASDEIWCKMIEQGWIRFRYNYPSWSITLRDINDETQLKRIENILFDSIKTSKFISVSIGEPLKHGIRFDWNDFLNSGISFVDFVKEKKSNI